MAAVAEKQPIGIAIPRSTELYHRAFADALKAAFPDQLVEARITAYPDRSPIPIVGDAEHVLMFAIYEGDNWETTVAHSIVLADAFKGPDEFTGPNAQILGVFFLDFEGRHDRKEEKVVNDSTRRARVKGQGIPARAFARSLRANGVDYWVTVNIHSNLLDVIFQDAGLEHIPLATEAVFIDKLISSDYLTPQTLPSVIIGTTDVGGLKEAMTAKRYLDETLGGEVPIAIIKKQRIPLGDGKSKTQQEFAWGNVKGKRVLVIDDRSDTVRSIKTAIDIYCEQGADEVVVYITHPVFADSDYYKTVQEILKNPKVKFIFVSNSLPMGDDRISRLGGVDIPYVWENGVDGKRHKKRLETLDIHPFILWAARTILTSPTIKDAKQSLNQQHALLEMRGPHELFEELTRTPLPRNQIIAIYDHGQLFSLPQSS